MLSVVLPLFNGAETLALQLSSLASQDYDGEWELVIADNGSEDASLENRGEWCDRLPMLRIVDAAARRGCAAADNIGAFAAARVRARVLRPGRRRATGLARVDGARARVDTTSSSVRTTSRPSTRASRRRVVRNRRRRPAALPIFYDFLPWGLSCNMGVSVQAFRAVGGFDEQLRGGDDVDLCWRIQLAGFPLHLEPDAVVAKRRRSTVRGVWEQHFSYGVHDVILFRKFRSDGHAAQTRPRAATLGVARGPPPRPRSRRSTELVGCAVAAGQAGRLVGSLRQRALDLSYERRWDYDELAVGASTSKPRPRAWPTRRPSSKTARWRAVGPLPNRSSRTGPSTERPHESHPSQSRFTRAWARP